MMKMHPADEIRGSKSDKLSNKKIILGVTGSIAAIESIKLSRELIRHGADVFPVMTKSAINIIHPNSLEFATSHKPIIELTGQTEHILLCGESKESDLLLISPCTANTISKIANGIDDTPVTTFASTAIGSNIPVMIVPAMHLSMYDHKVVKQNIEKCKNMGIIFIDPIISGNKARMPDASEIVGHVTRTVGKRDLLNKKILIVGGATAEPIDDIRIITNRSSGKTAVSLAKSAFERGANVTLWYGYGREDVPSYIPTIRFETVDDVLRLLENLNHDLVIMCAAIADYIPRKRKGKIPSGKEKLSIEMHPAPRIIQKIRPKTKRVIAFKTEENKRDLKDRAFKLLEENRLDLVVANTISAFGKDENEIFIINKKGECIHKKGSKEELAWCILDVIAELEQNIPKD
jgi:phosphopantothenoylcysteine decarboxylase/phosphopantothenate--cysteine ligase